MPGNGAPNTSREALIPGRTERSAHEEELTRSQTDRMVAGVIGGLGEYFNVDANLIRVLWVVITVFTGFIPGIVVYLLLWLILPQE